MSLDLSEDLGAIADNVETVTVILQRPGNTRTEISVENCLRREVSLRDMMSGGFVSDGTELVWLIPQNKLNPSSNGHEIRREDLIKTGDNPSETYVVLSVKFGVLRTRWRCVCQRRRNQ